MIRSNTFFQLKCKDCVHFVPLMKNNYEHSNVCTAYVDDTPPQKRDADCFVVEVKENDMCELYEEKKEKDDC